LDGGHVGQSKSLRGDFMGAFFLYDRNAVLDIVSLKKVFQEKGFSAPRLFDIGASSLLLYQKQLVDEPNYIESDGCALFVIGTVIYQGRDYNETKLSLLKDFQNDSVDKDDLQGNYCLLFYDGKKVTLLNDAMNVQHLFTNKAQQFITSSFLAAMAAVPEKLRLNRMACLEKLTTGYIVGKETLFEQVYHVTRAMQNLSEFGIWRFIKWDEIKLPDVFDRSGRKESATRQVAAIKEYLQGIKALAVQYKPEIGLSGGYDSRLLYAATFHTWPFKIAVHTHATEGVNIHDQEKEIVKQMTTTKGSPLKIIATKNMDSYEDMEIEDILKDGLYFFDGRCAYNMGAFSPVYTRKYKMSVVGDCRLALNGLGGEMYRNYYMVARPFIHSKEWMKAHIYSNCIETVFRNQKDLVKMHRHICGKMEQELGFFWRGWISNFNMRRYYSELRMPDCDALNCNAHNQIAFYLTPFIERRLLEQAYYGTRYVGISGEYQAEIIRQMDSELAAFPSHYGFNFLEVAPLKYRTYMFIRGWMPDSIWNARIRFVVKSMKEARSLKYFHRVAAKCEYLRNAASYAELLFPEVDFDELRKDYAMMPNSSYISVLLYEFRDRIES
jgi:hypothetical protein